MNKFYVSAFLVWAVFSSCQSPLASTETTGSPRTLPGTNDFSQEIVSGSTSDQIVFRFRSEVGSHFVDVHYRIDGGGLQNYRMVQNGALWTHSAAVPPQKRVDYFFTYDDDRSLATDSRWFAYVHTTTPILYGYVDTRWYVPGVALESCTLRLMWPTPDTLPSIDRFEIFVCDERGERSSYWVSTQGNTFSTTWTPNGSMSFFVRAVDSQGAVSARSEVLTLTY